MKQFYFILIVCIAQVQLEAMQSVKQLFNKTQKTILTKTRASFHNATGQSSKSVSVFRQSLPIAMVTLGLSYVYWAREGEVSRKLLSASSMHEHDGDRMITEAPSLKVASESAQNKMDFDLGTAIYNSDYESALKLLGQGAHPNALYAPLGNKPLLWVALGTALDVVERSQNYLEYCKDWLHDNDNWSVLELLLEKGASIHDRQLGSAMEYAFKNYYRIAPIFQNYADHDYEKAIIYFLIGIVKRILPYETEKQQIYAFKRMLSINVLDLNLSNYFDDECTEVAKFFVEKALNVDIDSLEEAITNKRMGSVKELLKHPKLDLSSLSSEVLQKADVSIQQCVHKELIERNIQLALPVPSFFQLDPH